VTEARLPGRFASSDEVDALHAAFEAASIKPCDWRHAEHIAIAVRHALWYDDPEATDRVREGILRLNAANGILQTTSGGYHETLTRFYMWAVRRHLRRTGVDCTLAQLINSAIDALGDRNLPLAYYSRERLMSWRARTSWVPPDLGEMEAL
jgi:hypothetical protein